MERLGSVANMSPAILAAIQSVYPHYQETDMQFNIARVEGMTSHALDIINPLNRDRALVTEASSPESEEMIRRALGRLVVPDRLPPIPQHPDTVTYRIPNGARPLLKSLRQSPYETPYMETLAWKAGAIMRALHHLDAGLFGVGPRNIAIVHDPEDDSDDASLMIVPPLLEANMAAELNSDDLVAMVDGYIADNLRDAFERGLITAPANEGN